MATKDTERASPIRACNGPQPFPELGT